MNKKVVVGLSGGIDSSMSLYFLKKQGFSPIGVSLKYCVWQDKVNKLKENICCTPESLRLAREVCQKLQVPHHLVDVSKEFQKLVIDYFIKSHKQLETPNPCVICNRFLKFPALLKQAKKFKADYIATGHYAQVKKRRGKFDLLRGKDKSKDQSYFLCLLTQKILSKTLFPLGNLTKKEVYKQAKKLGFKELVKKKESQDLCFVSSKVAPILLQKELGKKPGRVVDTGGKFLGEHQGLYLYTIGQRKGLNFLNGPWWVAGFKKPNILVVANKKDDRILYKKKIVLRNYNIISGEEIKKPLKIKAKVRFQHQAAAATLFPSKNQKLIIEFAKPQWAVTPGQFCVFYKREECLGGGKII